LQRGKPCRCLQIKCDGFLAAIEIEEFAIHAGRTALAGKLAQQITAWAFELDHLCAVFCQIRRCKPARPQPRKDQAPEYPRVVRSSDLALPSFQS
jgi:hypothetical protein